MTTSTLRAFQCFFIFLLIAVFSQTFISPVSAETIQCQQHTLSVKLSPLSLTSNHMVTWLCWRGNLEGKTIQVVIHGLTYDHNYWDFPYQQPNYSYVESAVDQGYAVLNMDRLGAGLSDHPLDTLVTLDSGAYVTHQVVQDLRSGSIEGTPFSKIVLVGHSAGSGIAILEASNYTDVDGIILSGYAHQLNATASTLIATDFYPAIQDPKFAQSDYSPGYITTRPGVRGSLFYDLDVADPQLISLDESLKQAGTSEELANLPETLSPTVSLPLHIPVFIADGQFDQLLCGVGAPCDTAQDMQNREQPFFTSSACLETFILPNSGHDINLHPNSGLWYAAANDWVSRRVGSSVSTPPTQPCQ